MGGAASMLGVVLPAIAGPSAARGLLRSAVTAVDAVAAVDVRIAIEVIVTVDGDVVVAAPPTVPTPTATPRSSHRNPYAERDRHSGRIVAHRRRIINGRVRVNRWAIHHRGAVAGYINDLRIRLFNDDDLLGFHYLRLNLLLVAGLQVARTLRLLSHALHRIH